LAVVDAADKVVVNRRESCFDGVHGKIDRLIKLLRLQVLSCDGRLILVRGRNCIKSAYAVAIYTASTECTVQSQGRRSLWDRGTRPQYSDRMTLSPVSSVI